MNGWIDPSQGPTVEPFGVPAAALPVVNLPLADAVRAEMASAGFTVAAAGGPGLVVGARTFVNAACLRAFAAAAGSGGRLVLAAPGWTRVAGGPPSRNVEVAIVPEGGDPSAVGRAALPAVEVEAEETSFEAAQGPESLTLPAPRHVACDVGNWSDLLWTNLFAMASRVRSMPQWQGLLLVLGAVARARSINKWRVAGKLVGRGAGCDIHPSAVVEASVLGRGVKIGPGAVVRGCVLGDGAEVEELALAVGSVIGERARVQRQAMLKFSLVFPRAAVGGGVQLSVLGEGCSIRMGAYTIDRRLDGSPIEIRTATGKHQAGPALGVAIGPGSSIGTGVWIAAGRMVPAGVILVRSPGSVLTKVDAALVPGTYSVEAGQALPVRQ